MAQQTEPPRPHGDPLAREIVEPNPAEHQSDAPDDAGGGLPGREEPTAGTSSTANEIPVGDETEGQQRRKRYDNGAELVSKID
jgi:hypothetical protein